MRRSPRILLAGIIAATSVVQLWLAHRYFGFLTGDDVEVLGAAFHAATGFHYEPWNIRNLFVPYFVVAPPIRLAAAAGIHDPGTLVRIATLPFIALTALSIWMVHRLALRWGASEAAALAAAALFAFHWIPLTFGSTVYPRTIATACTLAGAILAAGPAAATFVAGLLAGVAFADRFSEIVFLIPLLAVCVFTAPAKRVSDDPTRGFSRSTLLRAVALIVGTTLSITITCGLVDSITWGSAFSSIRKFAQLTLVAPDFASRVKYQSPAWYLAMLPRWCAVTMFPLLWRARREWRPWIFVAFPLLVLSLVRHKELRYLQGVVPFLCIAAAIGFDRMTSRRLAAALVAISLVWNVYGIKAIGKKTTPAVRAARMLGADPAVRGVVVSQLWAYGDRLYFGDRIAAFDVGTPPQNLSTAVTDTTDAATFYESDLDAEKLGILAAHGLHRTATFRDPPARAVVVFTRSASGTSDRVRR